MSRFRRSGDALAAPGREPRSGRGARLPAASSGTPAKRVLGLLVLCLGSICVGLSGVYVRPLIELLHPLEIAAIRSSVSAFAVALFVLMFSLIARPPAWRPSPQERAWLIAFGVVGIFGCNGTTLLTVSSEGSPGLGLSIILGVSVVAARIFERGLSRPSGWELVVGLAISAGLALLVGRKAGAVHVSLGMAGWGSLAGVLQGSMLLIIVRLEAPLGARLLYGFGVAAGLQVVLVLALLGMSPNLARMADPDHLETVAWMIGGGLITLAAAYALLSIGAKLNGSVIVAALVLCLEPITGLTADGVILREPLSMAQLLGAAILFATVMSYTLAKPRIDQKAGGRAPAARPWQLCRSVAFGPGLGRDATAVTVAMPGPSKTADVARGGNKTLHDGVE